MKITHLNEEPYGDEVYTFPGCLLLVTKYETGSYDGSGDALALFDAGVMHVNLGHCSCYGPYGDDGPFVASDKNCMTIEAFKLANEVASCGWPDDLGQRFLDELNQLTK